MDLAPDLIVSPFIGHDIDPFFAILFVGLRIEKRIEVPQVLTRLSFVAISEFASRDLWPLVGRWIENRLVKFQRRDDLAIGKLRKRRFSDRFDKDRQNQEIEIAVDHTFAKLTLGRLVYNDTENC